MGRKLVDLTGRRFERLSVVEYLGRVGHSSRWRCACDCGEVVEVQGPALRRGETKSCGCYRSDRMGGLMLRHGKRGGANRKSTPPEYKVWDSIKSRCNNPEAKDYANYGGRGIRMAAEWLDDPEAFMAHVGPRPSPSHSLDRIENDLGYVPGNVRWATGVQQARNKRTNRMVEFQGRMMPLVEAAELAGLPYAIVKSRVCSKGWPVERALSEPNRGKSRRLARFTRRDEPRTEGATR